MEQWSFGSDGKGLMFSDEMDMQVDAFARNRKTLMEWEARPYYNFDNNGLVSDRVASESVEYMELGFTDIMRKHFHNNQAVDLYGGDSSKRVASPTCMLTPHSSFGELESQWKPSSSVVECISQDSSLIDLKLGRLVDHNGASSKFSSGRSVVASGGSVVAAKRARTASSCSQTPFCQVQGCYMDLSSSKDYHKRHKVCDAHSKTARVIVDGMEQRFCQQCSRFHLLVEFDDGKRSCRRRLAGHNERRRKPQLHSFNAKSRTRSPFVFPSTHQGGVLYHEKYGEANQYWNVKLEKESVFNPQSAVSMMNAPLLANSFHLPNTGKQHCYGIPHAAASSVRELSGASNSSCALSLLSTQSNDLSSYPAGTPMGTSLFYPGQHADDHAGVQISERPVMANNGFYSSMTNPIDVDHMGAMMFSDSNGIFHSSGFPSFPSSKHALSPEHGTTIDLLQLSSHLQRVEQHRSFMPVKQESEDISSFLATQGALM